MDTTTKSIETILAEALAALPEKVTLVYISRGDELSDEQCQKLIAGEENDLLNDLEEAYRDSTDYGIDNALEEALEDENEREALKEDFDSFEEFRTACYERDDSTILTDLIRESGSQLVRFYIRDGKGERVSLPADSWRWDKETVEREAKRLAEYAKLDWTKNSDKMVELVQNASGGGTLCVIAYVEMSDINKVVQHCLYGDERGRVELTFTNPQLLVHDRYNGSGHDVQVDGDIVIRFGRGALAESCGIMELDAKGVGTGYSWDETAGPHKPAYKCDPKIRLYKAKKGQKPDKPSNQEWPMDRYID